MQVGAQVAQHRAWAVPAAEVAARSRSGLVAVVALHRMD
jgi:hypothetical protein